MGNVAWAALAIVLGATAASGQNLPSAADLAHARAIDSPAELKLWNRPIIVLRATIGNLTPALRVAGIETKFEDIPYAELENPVRIDDAEVDGVNGLMVFVGGRLLFGVVPADLDPTSGETMAQASARITEHLRAALAARAAARRVPVLLRGLGVALAATLAFVTFLWAIVRVRGVMLRRVRDASDGRDLPVFGVDVRPYAFGVLDGVARLVTATMVLAAAYVWLTLVFSEFPYTEPWSARLGRYLGAMLSGLGVGALDAVPGLFAVLVIFFFTRLVAEAANGFFTAVEEGRVTVAWLQPETAKATKRLSDVAIWLFGLTVAYPYIPGSETAAFRGVSVFAGIMISLGSAGMVNQVMSGLVVIYARALKPGDFVHAADTLGTVSEVGLLSTKVITLERQEVTIPNAVLVSAKVTNYSRLAEPDGSMASTSVTIGYDAPWRQVHALLLAAAGRTPGIRATPEPFVLQRGLSDFYVEYQLLVRLERPEMRIAVLSVLHAEIQDTFNDAGVQIMSPHFVAQPAEPVLGAPSRGATARASEPS